MQESLLENTQTQQEKRNPAAVYMKVELNKVYPKDCVKLMEDLDENTVDLTVTSPPYDDLRSYKGYSFDFENIAKQLYRVTKKGGVVVWVVGKKIKDGNIILTPFKQGLFFQEVGFKMHDIMIYEKKNTPFMRSNAYTNGYEFMFVLSKGKPKTFNPLKTKTARSGFEPLPYGKKADGINRKALGKLNEEKVRTNIWEYAVGMGGTTSDKIAFQHPAVFPEKLAEDHILSWSNEGDLVFDPMCGSGTTLKMAKLNGRKYLGCDISEEYVKIAKERLSNTFFQKKIE
jgi:site-specific DNA-methyltransferase (adenine-specific)